MKKLLRLIPTALLIASPLTAVVACGKDDSKTVTYGTVDNGKDNITLPTYKKMEELYYKLYGDEYKLKGVNEIGDNELPEKIMSVGPQAGPDVYSASVDFTSRLATANAILAINGPDAPEGEKGVSKILENLKYNEEYSQEVLDKYDSKKEDVTDLEQWTTWLPSAVKASKFVNRNPKSQAEGKPYQYGITRTLGVGGGSAITRIDKYDTLIKAGWKEKEGTPGTSDPKISFNQLIEGSAAPTPKNENAANDNLAIMIERGMWEMYPIYSNVISDPSMTKGKTYKAAEIGVNWVNPPADDPADGALHDPDVSVGKYSTIFTHEAFVESTKEVVGKWFDLWSQSMKVALKKLDNTGSDQKEQAINLLDPTNGINATVKMNMLNKGFISSTTAEPGNYADWTSAAGTDDDNPDGKGFANLNYVNLNSLNLFGKDDNNEGEKQLAKKYNDAEVNSWLTPSGSNQTVFSRNLAGKSGKIKAAIRWVELLHGFKENDKGEVVPNEEWLGGMYNLKDMYGTGSGMPSKLAIKNTKFQDEKEFEDLLAKKIATKVEKASDKDTKYKKVYSKNKEAEDKAIVRLEKFALNLAAGLYGSNNTLTQAPQVTAYDPATKNDWHGQIAMKTALTEAYFAGGKKRPDFESIFMANGEKINLYSEGYINVKNQFLKKFLTSMETLNKDMNK